LLDEAEEQATGALERRVDPETGEVIIPEAPEISLTRLAEFEEALELAVQVGTSRAAERFGVNPATLYYAWKRWGLERPTDRPEGARRALERKLAAARRADPERHPWRRDRSIWQRRTLDRTADRTAERTAGHER
jgi:transposase-like protein